MNFNRTSNREWVSEGGQYKIIATGKPPAFTYTAYFIQQGQHDEPLQVKTRQAGQQAANAAKDACEVHAAFNEGITTND